MSTFIFYTVLVIVGIVVVHAVIFNLSTSWIYQNVSLIYRSIHDPAAAAKLARREANPPWFERYANWLDSRLPGGKKRGAQ